MKYTNHKSKPKGRKPNDGSKDKFFKRKPDDNKFKRDDGKGKFNNKFGGAKGKLGNNEGSFNRDNKFGGGKGSFNRDNKFGGGKEKFNGDNKFGGGQGKFNRNGGKFGDNKRNSRDNRFRGGHEKFNKGGGHNSREMHQVDDDDNRKLYENNKTNNFMHKSQKEKANKAKFQNKKPDKGGYRQYGNNYSTPNEEISNVTRNPQIKKPKLEVIKKRKNIDSSAEEDEQPVVNYVLAPELLNEKLRDLKEFEQKNKVVNKREEYLKQRKRKEEILKQRTRKGQPVMAGRMQLLFEQVQKAVDAEKSQK